MSKGGGSPSTAGMEKVARESNALQERIYDESVARQQPFYDVGVSGLGKLADYLGIAGGSQQSEAQIREGLLPQYTSQVTSGGSMPAYTNQQIGEAKRFLTDRQTMFDDSSPEAIQRSFEIANSLGYAGAPMGTAATTSDAVDYAGLDSAVQNALATQGADKPDYFGSLLTPFGAEQFEADPAYAFRQAEGNKALERTLAAQGQTFTPDAVKALQDYNQNLASQEYTNAYNRYNMDQSNIYNRLANIAGVGQTSSQQLAGLGQNYASNVGATNASLANAQYQQQVADAQNRSSMFGSLGTLGGAAIGGLFGGPGGAMVGANVGGQVGGLF